MGKSYLIKVLQAMCMTRQKIYNSGSFSQEVMMIYNLADYRQIFALTDQDLQKNILAYPAGISSVNAELYKLGQPIISGDPLYHLSLSEIRNHARHMHLDDQQRESLELFLADYELGKLQRRYRVMPAPPPSTVKESFDLLLCSDFLFSQNNYTNSSQELMQALCQLATEIRVFPLPEKSVAAELGPIMLAFQQRNFGVEVRAVNYPQGAPANAMLRVWAKQCEVNSQTSLA
jgi:hypothetical protein